MLALFAIAAILIALLFAGCFAVLVSINAKIEAYHRLKGDDAAP